MMKDQELQKKADEMRLATLEMCDRSGTGHVSSSFSCAELLTTLYYGGILRHNPENPSWEGRDRFVASKGQASPIIYNILADQGYFPKEWLETFAQPGARLGVHMQCDVPGVEMTAGSLGHGLGIAAGRALAAKMDRKDYFTFALLGDAELYEGSNWEAAMFASHQQLNNLVGIVDRNWQGVIDYTEDAIALEPLEDKWQSYGWNTKRINGHSVPEIREAFEGIRSHKNERPYMIIADTVKGKGISFMEDTLGWHSLSTQGEHTERAKRELQARIHGPGGEYAK
jgi:transketolase